MELIHTGRKKESFARYYKRNFGKLEGRWTPVINAMLALMIRLEAEVQGEPLYGSTSHTTVVFRRPDLTDGFVCWFTYGLTFINGEGGRGNVSAYFIQDFSRTIHRAETVDEAVEIIAVLVRQCENRHSQLDTNESS
ncbi:MAG: hypothetical protein EOP06_25500 [Proteobacteria bacterium]|nr:MAG: hypothetical protein EOP06_25500 [Pseudomonadota bacterium]